MKKTLVLQRTHASPDKKRTFGRLTCDGDRFLCYSLEDQVREVAGQPVANWKLKGQTAIPTGTYPVTLVNSPRFGLDTLSVGSVPGFEYIRMHPGNTEADTEGCLLLGTAIGTSGIIGGTSRPAVNLVKSLVQQWIKDGHTVQIEVRQLGA